METFSVCVRRDGQQVVQAEAQGLLGLRVAVDLDVAFIPAVFPERAVLPPAARRSRACAASWHRMRLAAAGLGVSRPVWCATNLVRVYGLAGPGLEAGIRRRMRFSSVRTDGVRPGQTEYSQTATGIPFSWVTAESEINGASIRWK